MKILDHLKSCMSHKDEVSIPNVESFMHSIESRTSDVVRGVFFHTVGTGFESLIKHECKSVQSYTGAKVTV